MADLKAALMGRTVSSAGVVDHSSLARTPWLKLFVVTYDHQIAALEDQPLLTEGVVDGVSFWIDGPRQTAAHLNLTSMVRAVRQAVPPGAAVFTGGYLTYSSTGWLPPAPFWSLLNQTVPLYDEGAVQGFYVFAGSVLAAGADSHSHMNRSEYAAFDLPAGLAAAVTPWLGTIEVEVVDAVHGRPVDAAVSTVLYRPDAAVASWVTRKVGASFSFGGWAGLAGAPRNHSVAVEARGYRPGTAEVAVPPAGGRGQLRIALHPL